MRTVVSSGRSHSWALVNTGALPVCSFYNLWSTSTSVLVLEVLLFSHRPIKIEAAYISGSLPEAKIKIWIWTLNSGPLKMEKLYLCLTRKENCCPSNDTRTIIGLGVLYVLPEILGTAFRSNKVPLLFVWTINLDTEIVFSGKSNLAWCCWCGKLSDS